MALALVDMEVAGLVELGVKMSDPVSTLWGIWAERLGNYKAECAAIAAELLEDHSVISVRAMYNAVWHHDLSDIVKKHMGAPMPGWITTLEQLGGIEFQRLSSAGVPPSAELAGTMQGSSSSSSTACTAPVSKRRRFSEDESLGQQLEREGRLKHFCIPLALLREAASDTIDPSVTELSHNDCSHIMTAFFSSATWPCTSRKSAAASCSSTR
jgi:hypothetical protein